MQKLITCHEKLKFSVTFMVWMEIKASVLTNTFVSFMLFDKLWSFLSEIETDNFTVSMKVRLFDFHCLGLLFSPLFYEFSAKSFAQKV